MCRVAWYNLKTSQCYFKPCSEAFIPLISLSFPQIKCVFFFLPGYEKCGFWVKRSLWLWFQSICWNSRGNHFSSNPLIIWPKTKKTGAKPISHWLPLPRQSGGIFLGHEAGVPISFSTWILHFYAQAELFMHLKLQKRGRGVKTNVKSSSPATPNGLRSPPVCFLPSFSSMLPTLMIWHTRKSRCLIRSLLLRSWTQRTTNKRWFTVTCWVIRRRTIIWLKAAEPDGKYHRMKAAVKPSDASPFYHLYVTEAERGRACVLWGGKYDFKLSALCLDEPPINTTACLLGSCWLCH